MSTKRKAKRPARGAQSRREATSLRRCYVYFPIPLRSAARVLECDHSHLRRVLRNERGGELLTRYQDLCRKEGLSYSPKAKEAA